MTAERVSFPPLGSLGQIAECYLRALGLEVVSPPPTTQRTLDLGVAHCPEMICVPCKLLFGNYLEAAERGANTLIMLENGIVVDFAMNSVCAAGQVLSSNSRPIATVSPSRSWGSAR